MGTTGSVEILAKGTGSAVITANVAGKTAVCKVTVTKAVSGLKIVYNKKVVADSAGKNDGITVVKGAKPALSTEKLTEGVNKTIHWEVVSAKEISSDAALDPETVLAVDAKGKLTPVGEGIATVRATAVETGVSAELNVKVVCKLTKLTLSSSKMTIGSYLEYDSSGAEVIREEKAGGLSVLQFTPADATDKEVSWSVIKAQKTGENQKGSDKSGFFFGTPGQSSESAITTTGKTPVSFYGKPGIYTVQAEAQTGETDAKGKAKTIKATCTVTILGSVKELKVESGDKNNALKASEEENVDYSVSLAKGKSLSLKTTILMSGYGASKELVYSSTKPGVATVKKGKISVPKTAGSGATDILVSSRDGIHQKVIRVTVQ